MPNTFLTADLQNSGVIYDVATGETLVVQADIGSTDSTTMA